MFRARIGHFRPRTSNFRPNSRGSHFSPKNGLKTLQHIEQFIQESKMRDVQVEPIEVAASDHKFADFDIPQTLLDAVNQCGFTVPTPIQDQVIPVMLTGKDIIGIANTGTGKTAAFLIPLITRMQNQSLHKVLIMAPTRELALQIQQDFYKMSRQSGLTAVLCIGGTSVRQQIATLHRPFQFLIGTPGRIKDMASQREIHLSDFDGVVLDEVDRMLDMGFIHDVREILSQLPHSRQSTFFSATLPREVESLCQTFGNTPIKISVRTTEYAHTVEQKVIKLNAGQRKLEILYDLLCHQEEFNKVIIFGRTKHGVKRLADELDKRGFSVDSIHGNKSQAYRQRSLEKFKRHEISILVATDVAARGIDVVDVTHVINYDLPETIEDYVHRIGRTGRAGKAGVAVTLVDA